LFLSYQPPAPRVSVEKCTVAACAGCICKSAGLGAGSSCAASPHGFGYTMVGVPMDRTLVMTGLDCLLNTSTWVRVTRHAASWPGKAAITIFLRSRMGARSTLLLTLMNGPRVTIVNDLEHSIRKIEKEISACHSAATLCRSLDISLGRRRPTPPASVVFIMVGYSLRSYGKCGFCGLLDVAGSSGLTFVQSA
jgi:hypothetical protein